jgi:hypothetical protein
MMKDKMTRQGEAARTRQQPGFALMGYAAAVSAAAQRRLVDQAKN